MDIASLSITVSPPMCLQLNYNRSDYNRTGTLYLFSVALTHIRFLFPLITLPFRRSTRMNSTQRSKHSEQRARSASKRKSFASSTDDSDTSSPIRRRPTHSKSFAGTQRTLRRMSSSLRRPIKRRSAVLEVSKGPRRNSIQWLLSNRVRAVSGCALASREPEFDAVYQFLYDGLVSGVSKYAAQALLLICSSQVFVILLWLSPSLGIKSS